MYHLHVKNISRSEGRSAVACAAYRAGETLPNEREEAESAFGGRRDVRHAEIRLPVGAPEWMGDRAALWNAVEAAEKRKDARLAKEIEFSIPRPLPRPMWLEFARAMADAYTARGHVVDLAIHDDDSAHNPHVHLMLTTRAIGGDGFGGKLREADGVAFVREARALWERIANAALGRAGSAVVIDARSYAARGIDKTPGKHRGPDPLARREKRREAERMSPLDHDILEARREMLAEAGARERFPLLGARADWPPEGREAPGGMSEIERNELKSFWREVDRRCFGATEREPEKARQAPPAERVPAWAELKASLERLRESGVAPDSPEWARIEQAVRQCEVEIQASRDQGEENRRLADEWRGLQAEEERLLPVPDPDGNPVAPAEVERAEQRLLDDMHGQPPRDVAGSDGRHAAEEAVLRQAQIEVSDREATAFRLAPQENRLDWLSSREPVEPAIALERESADDRLDWLREQPEPKLDHDEPERDRQRR